MLKNYWSQKIYKFNHRVVEIFWINPLQEPESKNAKGDFNITS